MDDCYALCCPESNQSQVTVNDQLFFFTIGTPGKTKYVSTGIIVANISFPDF